MLGVSTLLLAVRALAKGLELARHLLDGSGEVGQLASDGRYVLFGGQVAAFYAPEITLPGATSRAEQPAPAKRHPQQSRHGAFLSAWLAAGLLAVGVTREPSDCRLAQRVA